MERAAWLTLLECHRLSFSWSGPCSLVLFDKNRGLAGMLFDFDLFYFILPYFPSTAFVHFCTSYSPMPLTSTVTNYRCAGRNN